jgi:hypothetical protein
MASSFENNDLVLDALVLRALFSAIVVVRCRLASNIPLIGNFSALCTNNRFENFAIDTNFVFITVSFPSSLFPITADLHLEDSGFYTCTAFSESGETSWSASLTVS